MSSRLLACPVLNVSGCDVPCKVVVVALFRPCPVELETIQQVSNKSWHPTLLGLNAYFVCTDTTSSLGEPFKARRMSPSGSRVYNSIGMVTADEQGVRWEEGGIRINDE